MKGRDIAVVYALLCAQLEKGKEEKESCVRPSPAIASLAAFCHVSFSLRVSVRTWLCARVCACVCAVSSCGWTVSRGLLVGEKRLEEVMLVDR